MRCLAACQTELAIRMLDEILVPSFEVEFLVESKPLARRLHDSGLNVVFETSSGPTPTSRLTSHQGPAWWSRTTAGRASAKSSSPSGMQGAHWFTCSGSAFTFAQARGRAQGAVPRAQLPALSELFGGPLLTEFSRSLTRLKSPRHQRFFSDADRVLILLHNDPIPMPSPADWRCATCCGATGRRRSLRRSKA